MLTNGTKVIFKEPTQLNTNENNFTSMNQMQLEKDVLIVGRLFNGRNQSHRGTPNNE